MEFLWLKLATIMSCVNEEVELNRQSTSKSTKDSTSRNPTTSSANALSKGSSREKSEQNSNKVHETNVAKSIKNPNSTTLHEETSAVPTEGKASKSDKNDVSGGLSPEDPRINSMSKLVKKDRASVWKESIKQHQDVKKIQKDSKPSSSNSSSFNRMNHPDYRLKFFKCRQLCCAFATNDEVNFTKHISLHKKEESVKCFYCHGSFKIVSGKELTEHMLKEHGKRKFQCAYCNYRAISETHVKLHLKYCHIGKEERVLKCKEMSQELPKIPKYERRPFICKVEDCTFESHLYKAFEEHTNIKHQNSYVFRCSYCKETSSNLTKLMKHYTMHKMYPHNCLYCDSGAACKEALLRHMAVHHPDYPLEFLSKVETKRCLKNGSATTDGKRTNDPKSLPLPAFAHSMFKKNQEKICSNSANKLLAVASSNQNVGLLNVPHSEKQSHKVHVNKLKTVSSNQGGYASSLPDQNRGQSDEEGILHSFYKGKCQVKALHYDKLFELPSVLYHCLTCNAQNITCSQLKDHIKQYHFHQSIIKCGFCPSFGNERQDFTHHMNIVHPCEGPVFYYIRMSATSNVKKKAQTTNCDTSNVENESSVPNRMQESQLDATGSKLDANLQPLAPGSSSGKFVATCDTCFELFPSYRLVSEHIRKRHDATKKYFYQCNLCELLLDVPFMDIYAHFMEEHLDRPIQVTLSFDNEDCSKPSNGKEGDEEQKSASSALKHKKETPSFDREGSSKPSNDEKKSTDLTSSHKRKKRMKYKCVKCSRVLRKAGCLKNHLRLVHKLNDTEMLKWCSYSERVEASNVKRHLVFTESSEKKRQKTAYTESTSMLKNGSSIASSSSILNNQESINSFEITDVVCPFCGSCGNAKWIKNHLYEELGYKPYQCNSCQFSAVDKSTICQHSRDFHQIHHEKECSYKVVANQVFELWVESYVLKQETGSRTKIPNTSSRLYPLVLRADDGNNVKCPFCKYKKKRKELLKSHLHHHLNYMPFACKICEYKSTNEQDICNHIARQHCDTEASYDKLFIGAIDSWIKHLFNEETEDLCESFENVQDICSEPSENKEDRSASPNNNEDKGENIEDLSLSECQGSEPELVSENLLNRRKESPLQLSERESVSASFCTASSNELFKCAHCDEGPGPQSLMKDHWQLNHHSLDFRLKRISQRERKMTCCYCLMELNSRSALRQHSKTFHPDRIIKFRLPPRNMEENSAGAIKNSINPEKVSVRAHIKALNLDVKIPISLLVKFVNIHPNLVVEKL